MAKRSYHQHCGLAVGLDLLAERWTLLVVRELLPGGRRFNDIFDALPGVSTDLLTARLRSLEEAGVVARRTIRHPARATLYELTDWGEELRPILEQLASWGVRLLPEPGHPDYRLNHRWALGAIAMSYRGGLPDGAYGFTLDDEDLTITILDGRAQLFYGPPSDEPVAHVTSSLDNFYGYAIAGGADLDDVVVTGDAAALRSLMTLLPQSDSNEPDSDLVDGETG